MTIRRIAAPAAMLLLVGCGFFSRSKNEYYALETVPAPVTAAAAAAPPVAVDGIELPPGIDRRSLVVRNEANRVEVRGNHLWTSPLEEMVIHTLAFDLAHRLPQGSVVLPGQAKPAGALRAIYVTFEDLAANAEGQLVLDARWSVNEGGTRLLSGHEQISVTLESDESRSIAAAMSSALGQLADRIAARL